MTFALVLANVFVFAVLQSGDARARGEAIDAYLAADLAPIEFPAYADWLRGEEKSSAPNCSRRWPGPNRVTPVAVLQHDRDFVAALADGRVRPVTAPAADDGSAHADWRAARAAFERAWEEMFTLRWMQRFDRFDATTLISATFLHANLAHLLGNMLFLAVLGLLVEGALGRGLFLGIYLLGRRRLAGIAGLPLGRGRRRARCFRGGGGPDGGLLRALGHASRALLLVVLRRLRLRQGAGPGAAAVLARLGAVEPDLQRRCRSRLRRPCRRHRQRALLAMFVRWRGWERKEFMDEDVRADEDAAARAAVAEARACLGRLRSGACARPRRTAAGAATRRFRPARPAVSPRVTNAARAPASGRVCRAAQSRPMWRACAEGAARGS